MGIKEGDLQGEGRGRSVSGKEEKRGNEKWRRTREKFEKREKGDNMNKRKEEKKRRSEDEKKKK